jgi:hypothetical protein
MNNLLMVRTHTLHRCMARLAVIVLFAALLSAASFNAAFAQTAPALGSAANFEILGGPAVTCTGSTIVGDVGSGLPGSAITQTNCTINGTVHQGDATAIAAYNAVYTDFLNAYNAIAAGYPCTGTLDTVYTDATLTLTPGVYCNDAAVTFTRTTLTLDGQNNPNAVWIFKIGTLGTGALTGTSLSVVMANGGQPCNVYWWVAQAATMTTSNFKGNILAGAATTFTGGSLIGRDFAQAGLTMTGLDVLSCSSLVPPLPPIVFCKDFCMDYCKDIWNDHDQYHCKDHEKDYCKDHRCMDHDKARCKNDDRDHDKDHRDRR